MTVRAVTPRVVAISGHLQFYRDADFFDADQDDRAVGDPYDLEWPDKPLRLSSHRASDARPARGSALSTDPMNAPALTKTGRDGRAAGATSSKVSALGNGVGESSALLGGGPDGSHTGPHAGPALSPGVSAGAGKSSPDRGQHTPGSGVAACDVALSRAPEPPPAQPLSGARTSSDEKSRPGWSPDGS